MPPKNTPYPQPAEASVGKSVSTNKSGNPAPPKPNKRKVPPQQNAGPNRLDKDSDSVRGPKRPKIHEVRSIAAQKSHAALKDGELNVQSFVNSLSFEMNALDESMRRTRTSQSSRAFQRVPFRMRRRAAAHNYKKVPIRLRKRAIREMEEDNTPTVNSKTRKPKTTKARVRAETARRLGILVKRKRLQKLKSSGADKETISIRAARPKIRRNTVNEPTITAKKFRRRQISKTWLPTHLWHAKRARMTPPKEPLWRFSIPITPTQKVYRPTHRIQWEKGAMAWDMSYMSTIGLSGPQNSVQNIIRSLGLTQEALWNDKAKRWRSGNMHWSGMLTRRSNESVQTIGPATVIWNPEREVDDADKRKQFRQLYIRIHPSAFLELFNEVLRLAKAQNPRPYVEDLRFEIGSIDITGPDSTEALLGVLKAYPSKSDGKELHVSKFESLAGLKDPGTLPFGCILAFSVADPRLHYPPRQVALPKADDSNAQKALLEAISGFRKEESTNPYQLFDRDARFKASKLPSQQSLNRRRSKATPGTNLKPTMIDPPIPIILLASRHSKDAQSAGTWTLMLPWKCVLPIWYSLMHYPLSTGGNPWFGGLDEIRHLTFERGLPWFPGDLPGTDAGKVWELDERKARQKAWDRRPKAKRVNWESLDLGAGRKGEVGVGWSCDYEVLLGLKKADELNRMSIDRKEGDKGPNESPQHGGQAALVNPLESLTQLSKSTFTAHQLPTSEPPPPTSLSTVSIRILGRGIASTCARIYRLPDIKPIASSTRVEVPATNPRYKKIEGKVPPNLRDQWLAQKPSKGNPRKKVIVKEDLDLETRQQLIARQLLSLPDTYPPAPPNSENIQGHHPLCPGEEDLIGFVTTGSFNLRDGRGDAIGSLSATKTAEELRRYKNKNDPAIQLCVVRNAGQNVGWLARWELI
ncbi:ribonucleases P/MRP protein subunit POP1-domain-containing protein [Annulohypoxylon maeteangense]|uniref:ribonucleases P/MRP protein subunit POP1-domain-containing protein n=1 Tax=Annulohypoxylon maeteangense TaxID=1927788 RepID=UPI0020083B4D|nr:ribonucleases P/MRP protein subunit POP1-domain-containing protein [Annulohypoxylon maeteangense]KAI0883973.1 ribonucleases P/MRP protein subunit POP1-domain-containing protein [Annulohypoxylon maeteangense]